MANYEATRYDYDGQYLTGVEGLNTGIIVPWSSAAIPSGFLECEGSAVNRTTYSALFAVVGTTYGIGDGSTTFNVPNLTDRCCLGSSPTKALAGTAGANTVTSTGNLGGAADPTTLTSDQMSSHSHPGAAGNLLPSGPGGPNSAGSTLSAASPPAGQSGTTGGGTAHTHSVTGNFTGAAESVLQPYLAVVYIIKT